MTPKTKKENTKKTRRSNLLSYIKTVDELLQHRELFQKFMQIIDIRDVKPKHKYKTSTEETNDDLIQLLIDLDLIEYDWDEMKKQTHRVVGNRIIEFEFYGDKIIELHNRITGKNSRIKREALELIARDIGDRFTFYKIVEIFTNLGVPETIFIKDTKWRAVFYILSYYTSSKSEEDYIKALKIIQETIHPLMFAGDEDKTKETIDKYNKWLKYNNITIDKDGQIYTLPTDDESNLGIDDWVSIDGKIVEPKSYVIYPDHLAEFWVLLSQVSMLTQAYQSNTPLDRESLENLYLEIIDKIENIVGQNKIGKLSETYERPFTSLATAEVEAVAKKAENSLNLISFLLLGIAKEKPGTKEIAKKLKENDKLIERVRKATKAISGKEIKINKLSYEQAVFMLKIIIGRISNTLEASYSGYLLMVNERLNAQYIILIDNLKTLLKRDDFAKIKKSMPDYLPDNLFENLDDMDVWWENGGKAGMLNFYGDIESMWVRAGQQTFPLPQWLILHLYEIDDSVSRLQKTKSKSWSKMMESIDEKKENGEFDFGQNEKNTQQPLQVQIVGGAMEVEGLKDGLSSIATSTKQKSSPKKDIQRTDKKKVFISTRNGIYQNEKTKKPSYAIKGNKRPKIITILKDGRKDINILCQTIGYKSNQMPSKEIKEINSHFKNKLKLKDDLIIRLPTGGYDLNREKYNIKFVN
ncbi:MAG: hypothetical protein HOE19_01565 [Candidatus Komeilibacteria bacterium]|mgnify:CR=1 FL=1|jgi:hypothetical protein|nr:hypothetical protein [Candidatus Komeilibacteria bacterium]MBT4447530.1 hypothetical protein [Candidatus Komeilibacteria bacterium]